MLPFAMAGWLRPPDDARDFVLMALTFG